MRIIFLTNDLDENNGWSIVGKNLISNIPALIDVYQSEKSPSFLFNKKSLKSEAFFKYGFFPAIIDFLIIIFSQRNRPDIIHCNIELFAPLAYLLSIYYRAPYTITSHGTYGLLPKSYFSYKLTFRKAEKVICVSNYTKNRMLENNIKANYFLINLGVDKRVFYMDPKINKENIIVFVGNYKKRKGFSFLFETLLDLKKEKIDFKLFFVGDYISDSIQHTYYSTKAKEELIDIKFLNSVSDDELLKIYNMAKINVLPSLSSKENFEGFGLIHLEANACGTLTIGALNSGNEDAIKDKNGYLIEYGNKMELSLIIKSILLNETYPTINSNIIREWKTVGEEFFNLFEILINIRHESKKSRINTL